LAQRLVDNSFADTVFFGNSGAEACELALKIARKYQSETGHPERYRIIACDGSFHGRTLATLAAAGNEAYLKGFGPKMEGFDHVAFGNLNEMRAAIGKETAAIFVEPIQGEGGVRAAPAGYLRGLREIADEFGLLLVYDEVQSGMGRTGKLFAHEWEGVPPDVMAIAKALGGGFPIGACLATERAATGMVAGTHGSTFGGNPLAVAAGNAVLDVMLAPGFFERVDAISQLLWERLDALVRSYPKLFAELRGSGLLLGIRCVVPAGDFVSKLRQNGLLTLTAGENVLRILPPLIVGEREIDEALGVMHKVAAEWPA
jgi:acetylornithine/N-succinyldiaminopimelate aminotransferase